MECKKLQAILLELQEYAKDVQQEEVEKVVEKIIKANRVFIAGAGRSGFAARAFANRLLHLGFSVHFVGEPTTPPIKRGDLLLIGSGSGTTGSLVQMAKKAKAFEAALATVTISPASAIGSMADAVITLPGTSKQFGEDEKAGSIQPVGSMFEQLSWLVYDSMVMMLKEVKHQTNADLLAKHANLE